VMQMSDRDDAAAAYYEDPENRQLKGSGQKRPRQPGRLTTHVPIRFSAGIIERVKDLAADDGKTVSSWIRDVVEREVLRRERSSTVGIMPTVQWKERTSEPHSDTLSSGEQRVEELHRLAGLYRTDTSEGERPVPRSSRVATAGRSPHPTVSGRVLVGRDVRAGRWPRS
jgi:hypothetical protein